MDAHAFASLPLWYAAFLFSTTCHEAAHALAAKWGGDDTALRAGQVGIDPIPHIRREPVGMVAVPLVSFFFLGGNWMIGWASTPYDPLWAARHPRRAAWMAAAGPGANLGLVLLTAAVIHGGLAGGWLTPPDAANYASVVALANGESSAVTMFLSVMFTLNLLLFLFNLMPVPPLDGQAVAGLFMNERTSRRWTELTQQPGFSFLGLLVAWAIFGRVFGAAFLWALNALYPGSHYG